MVIALFIACCTLILAVVGELIHARRVQRAGHLAFGATGKPAAWTAIVPPLRCAGIFLATFGAVVLAQWDPVEALVKPNPRADRQLLICLDVSPSMQIADSGPETEKVSRARWAGKVTQGILDRVDMKDTRITMVGFYSKALPILRDTTDKNVVSNLMDGLPMSVAFEPGATDLAAGVTECLKLARPWARKSATLVVISDGDVEKGVGALGAVSMPPSIADTIVIGVGDPVRPTLVSGHSSRQDTWSLKQLAARLGGYYHDGNRLHLPSAVLEKLTMMSPRSGSLMGLREAALVALGVGSGILGLAGPMLMWLGTPRAVSRQRANVRARFAADSGGVA
jgi:hypothetical protein